MVKGWDERAIRFVNRMNGWFIAIFWLTTELTTARADAVSLFQNLDFRAKHGWPEITRGASFKSAAIDLDSKQPQSRSLSSFSSGSLVVLGRSHPTFMNSMLGQHACSGEVLLSPYESPANKQDDLSGSESSMITEPVSSALKTAPGAESLQNRLSLARASAQVSESGYHWKIWNSSDSLQDKPEPSTLGLLAFSLAFVIVKWISRS